MKRIGMALLGALLVLPAAAHAQRPGNNMQIRSAELYLDRANKSQLPAEKAKFYQQALDMATQAATADAGNSKSWFTLGKIYAMMGDAIGADSALTRAEKMWPEYAKETDIERLRAYIGAFNAGITAIQKNDLAGATKNLEAASIVYHKKPTAALNLGNLYARANQPDKAAQAYRSALAVMRGPERKTLSAEDEKQWAQWEEAAAFNLAQILATSDKNEEAVQAYLDYLSHSPNNITAKSNLAIVYNRMGKTAEAQKIYTDLLGQDLSDEDYFLVGVGLFRGDQFGPASDAFRKAIAKNGSFRDAYYNLAQAIYSQITPLEDARAKAKPTELKGIDEKLTPLYTELISVSQKARELDPNNRNILALLARANRGMADVDAKNAASWKNKTLEVMQQHQDMPYEVMDVTITNNVVAASGSTNATAATEAKVTGNLVNLKGTEGQTVTLNFSVLGKDGKVLGTQDVTVKAPKVEDQVPFSFSIKTTEPLGGWKYQVAK
jgi:tetratricopeptide (TPR) repeat protein